MASENNFLIFRYSYKFPLKTNVYILKEVSRLKNYIIQMAYSLFKKNTHTNYSNDYS